MHAHWGRGRGGSFSIMHADCFPLSIRVMGTEYSLYAAVSTSQADDRERATLYEKKKGKRGSEERVRADTNSLGNRALHK